MSLEVAGGLVALEQLFGRQQAIMLRELVLLQVSEGTPGGKCSVVYGHLGTGLVSIKPFQVLSEGLHLSAIKI